MNAVAFLSQSFHTSAERPSAPAAATRPEARELAPYRLPDGTVVHVDATAVKGARSFEFQLKDGRMVTAERIDAEHQAPTDWMYHAYDCAHRQSGADRGPCSCGVVTR
jgi:hypothetical protein